MSNEQAYDLAFGDDFSNIVYSTFTGEEDERKEAESEKYFDVNDAFDPSLAKTSDSSVSEEESHIVSHLMNAALEAAVGGTQIAQTSGGGGGSDNSWDRQMNKDEFEEYRSTRRRGSRG